MCFAGAKIFTGAPGFAPAPGLGGAAAAFTPRAARPSLNAIGDKPVSSYSTKAPAGAPAKAPLSLRMAAPRNAPAPGPEPAVKSYTIFG